MLLQTIIIAIVLLAKFVVVEGQQLTELYHVNHTDVTDNMYTISYAEVQSLVNGSGNGSAIYEGVLGYISTSKACPCHQPLYRFYNRELDNHFYTAFANEVSVIQADKKYNDEGIIGYVPLQPCGLATNAVFRFYSAQSSDHVYLTKLEDILRYQSSNSGYSFEGYGFFVWSTNVTGQYPCSQ